MRGVWHAELQQIRPNKERDSLSVCVRLRRAGALHFSMALVVGTAVGVPLYGAGRAAAMLPDPADGHEPQLSDSFESLVALWRSGWYDYLDQIYGASTLRFPCSLRQLGFFYTSRIPGGVRFREHPRSALTRLEGADANVVYGPMQRGELYRTWGGDLLGTSWAQLNLYRMLHALDGRWSPEVDTPVGGPSPRGFASHERVEVMHTVGDARGSGMWFYYAKGSGIYFDVGRTVVYRDHLHAARELGIPCADLSGKAARFEFPKACADAVEGDSTAEHRFQLEATRRGAAAGYDSIQFARHPENHIWRFEILATNVFEDAVSLDGKSGCPARRYATRFSRGWGGVEACMCRAAPDINCDGEPEPNDPAAASGVQPSAAGMPVEPPLR